MSKFTEEQKQVVIDLKGRFPTEAIEIPDHIEYQLVPLDDGTFDKFRCAIDNVHGMSYGAFMLCRKEIENRPIWDDAPEWATSLDFNDDVLGGWAWIDKSSMRQSANYPNCEPKGFCFNKSGLPEQRPKDQSCPSKEEQEIIIEKAQNIHRYMDTDDLEYNPEDSAFKHGVGGMADIGELSPFEQDVRIAIDNSMNDSGLKFAPTGYRAPEKGDWVLDFDNEIFECDKSNWSEARVILSPLRTLEEIELDEFTSKFVEVANESDAALKSEEIAKLFFKSGFRLTKESKDEL